MENFKPAKRLFGLFLLCLFILTSCSKDEEAPTTTPGNISTEKAQYAPYEIVTIKSTEAIFSGQSFPAKINAIDVKLESSDSLASFILPSLEAGKYMLTFMISEKAYSTEVTVLPIPNVLNSDIYFNDFTSDINQTITALNSEIAALELSSGNSQEYDVLQNDLTMYTNLLNEYTVKYNNLSTEEKLEFAKFMAANDAPFDELTSLSSSLTSSLASLRTSQSIQDYEAGVEISKANFVRLVIKTVAHIPAIMVCADLMAVPG